MSEPRFDLLDAYARDLDREAGLIVPPTSPSEVRRAGTSRQRRSLFAVIAVLVVVALTLGGVVIANLTSRNAAPNWATTPRTSQTPVATSSAEPTASASRSGSSRATTSSTSLPTNPPSMVQPLVVAGDYLTMLGIGQLKIGMARSDLVDRGVMSAQGGCDATTPTPTLTEQGVMISSTSDTVDFILLTTSQHATQSGVKRGMTMGEVKQVYGDKITAKTVTLQIGDPTGNTREAYVISSGNSLVIMSDSRGPIQADDVVTSIYLLKGSSLSVPVEIC